MNIPAYCEELGLKAQAASRALADVSGARRDDALRAIAAAIRANAQTLKRENKKDLEAGEANGLSSAMLDRLKIDDAGVEKIAKAVEEVAAQGDPLGAVLEGKVLPNGIKLQKLRVPIGVVLIIFESRPNVTSDAAALCLKSGNACVLRGGKEAVHSNKAIAKCVQEGLSKAGLDPNAVQLVETTDRAAVGELLRQEETIDLCIPRGGKSLIRAVVEQAHIPVIKHYNGICHTYVDGDCDEQMAVDLCVNGKTQRTGVCNATETILLHNDVVESGLAKKICDALVAKSCEIRGCEKTQAICSAAKAATEEDWGEEYLDLIVSIKIVDSIDEAIGHINQYGSKHTDAIVTTQIKAAEKFTKLVDTANAFVNCSTRFSDGGEYGLGAEIGISTDKLHSRGPMGAADLTTYKWVAYGDGQIRG
ncbi:Gamma-glutamyl phosphate reductase [Poriferisphaera corsica]|uniref:Gamma-glutamyl phosphate reductase n=2 Tax=Poriferisphaera corsica TaxID=2528020 RepID=A0A517YU20_9BACT|nr:Gamma-glutamyl phosphate reductase [Poriferisphaera corsica]